MSDDQIPITLEKILQSKLYTLFVMQGEGKRFGIYTEPKVGETLQSILSEKKNLRPPTHELLDNILKGLNVTALRGVIYDFHDGVYFSQLFLEQMQGEQKVVLEIDSRPSDCLTIALINNIPLFCDKQAFEKIEGMESPFESS